MTAQSRVVMPSRPVLAACIAAVVATPLVAATATGTTEPAHEAARSMTLGEAIAFARAHQPAVLVGLARVALEEEASKAPRAEWLPRVGVNAQLVGSTTNNSTATVFSSMDVPAPRIGGTPVVSGGSWRPYATTFVGAGANQEVFDFGRIAAESAAADARVEVERYASRTALLDVTYDVEEAYFAVEAAKAVERASNDAYARAKAHRDLAKAGVASGMRPPIELTRAEADLARFDAGRIRAHGGVTTSQAVLAATVGAIDALVDTVGTSAQPDDLPALNEAIAAAGSRDPRILLAVAQLRADEAQADATAAKSRPNLALLGAITGRAGGAKPSSGPMASSSGFVPEVPNWDVALVLSWPLFDPTTRALAATARKQAELRREELAQARYAEVAAIRAAYISVQIARDSIPALEQSVTASRANWEQADARFRGGLGTAVELADAEAVLADAEINLALGVFAVARARAQFGRTIAERL